MSFLGTVKNYVVALAQRSFNINSNDEGLWSSLTSGPVVVNEANALQLSSVWGCTRVLSETPASLPISLFKSRASGKGRDKVKDHPAAILLMIPNSEMTWMNYLETIQAHCVNWGNGYSYIERDRAGFPIALWPLLPDRTFPERNLKTREMEYRTVIDPDLGVQVILPAHSVLHVKGLGFDGLKGYSVIGMARRGLSGAMSADRYGQTFFEQGMKPSTAFTTEHVLGDKAYERLKTQLNDRHAGVNNFHKPLLLEDGLKNLNLSLTPMDAQFLEQRQFSVAEVCRWYRVQPHKVMDLSRATFSNIEQQNIEHAVDTQTPWLTRWEQELNRNLLTKEELMAGFFFKFNMAGLVRGDIETRYKAYAVGRQWGWFSANDIRELEDMNPLPGDEGDIYLNPMNMVPAGELTYVNKEKEAPPEDKTTAPPSEDSGKEEDDAE